MRKERSINNFYDLDHESMFIGLPDITEEGFKNFLKTVKKYSLNEEDNKLLLDILGVKENNAYSNK